MGALVTAVPLRLSFHPDADVDPDVLVCEFEVLNHWYGDTRDLLDEAYGPYQDQTCFLTLHHATDGVVGFCRLILPGPLPLKTIVDIDRPPWNVDGHRAAAAAGVDVSRTWDIATLGMRHQILGAGSVAAAALYHGLILATRANEIPWLTAIIDRRVRSLLSSIGLPLQALPGTQAESYMGSPACAPVYTHLPSILDAQRRNDPDAYRLVSLGSGLDGVAVPALADFTIGSSTGAVGLGRPALGGGSAFAGGSADDQTHIDLRDPLSLFPLID